MLDSGRKLLRFTYYSDSEARKGMASAMPIHRATMAALAAGAIPQGLKPTSVMHATGTVETVPLRKLLSLYFVILNNSHLLRRYHRSFRDLNSR